VRNLIHRVFNATQVEKSCSLGSKSCRKLSSPRGAHYKFISLQNATIQSSICLQRGRGRDPTKETWLKHELWYKPGRLVEFNTKDLLSAGHRVLYQDWKKSMLTLPHSALLSFIVVTCRRINDASEQSSNTLLCDRCCSIWIL
jgi:hypothetical protein